MHRTVPLECCGFTLVEKINCNLSVTLQKRSISIMVLTAYRAAGLRVNMLNDNIEMDIKELPLMTSGLNTFNT